MKYINNKKWEVEKHDYVKSLEHNIKGLIFDIDGENVIIHKNSAFGPNIKPEDVFKCNINKIELLNK